MTRGGFLRSRSRGDNVQREEYAPPDITSSVPIEFALCSTTKIANRRAPGKEHGARLLPEETSRSSRSVAGWSPQFSRDAKFAKPHVPAFGTQPRGPESELQAGSPAGKTVPSLPAAG